MRLIVIIKTADGNWTKFNENLKKILKLNKPD